MAGEDWSKKNEKRAERIERHDLKVAEDEKDAKKNIKAYLKARE